MQAVTVHGETTGERDKFVLGYKLGMLAAAEIVKAMATAAGEKIGEAPTGSLTDAKNRINGAVPQGNIIATYIVS